MDSHSTPDAAEKGIVQSRRPHTARGWGLFMLSFSSLGKLFLASLSNQQLISRAGVVCSSIATSPLYVLNSIWLANEPAPPKEDVIGGISAIIWAMMLLPLLKYASTPFPLSRKPLAECLF